MWNFYANQLVFRVKQPYTLNFVEIPVGVVSHLADFTENPPIIMLYVIIVFLSSYILPPIYGMIHIADHLVANKFIIEYLCIPIIVLI